MILQVMVVYDSVARAYLQPFMVSHVDIGKRAFADAANGQDQVARHPQDFTLFHLGSWNDDSCEFSFLAERVNLGLASAYKTMALGSVAAPTVGEQAAHLMQSQLDRKAVRNVR